MQIDEFQRLDQYGASVGLAFDPKQGGTHYCFVVANRTARSRGSTGMSATAVGNGWKRSRRSR